MKFFKLAIIVSVLMTASPAWSKGPGDVTNGVHNLSLTGVDQYEGTSGSSLYASDEDQVCVFCHTPHGGSLTGPLWNRSNPNPISGWSHYNSATMSISGVAAERPPNDESMLCMSCHDGSISVYHLINTPNDRDGDPIKQKLFFDENMTIISDSIYGGGPGRRIGGGPSNPDGEGDLSDDHPVSFSYNQVYGSADYAINGSKFGQLVDPAIVVANKVVRLFGAARNVECSSCHDPHVDYLTYPEYTPFLISTNSGSAICLACHVK